MLSYTWDVSEDLGCVFMVRGPRAYKILRRVLAIYRVPLDPLLGLPTSIFHQDNKNSLEPLLNDSEYPLVINNAHLQLCVIRLPA